MQKLKRTYYLGYLQSCQTHHQAYLLTLMKGERLKYSIFNNLENISKNKDFQPYQSVVSLNLSLSKATQILINPDVKILAFKGRALT